MNTELARTLIRCLAAVAVVVACLTAGSCGYSKWVIANAADPLATACALRSAGGTSVASVCLAAMGRRP